MSAAHFIAGVPRASGTTAGTAAGAPAHMGEALRVLAPVSAGGAAKQGQGAERAAKRARSCLGPSPERAPTLCTHLPHAPRPGCPCT